MKRFVSAFAALVVLVPAAAFAAPAKTSAALPATVDGSVLTEKVVAKDPTRFGNWCKLGVLCLARVSKHEPGRVFQQANNVESMCVDVRVDLGVAFDDSQLTVIPGELPVSDDGEGYIGGATIAWTTQPGQSPGMLSPYAGLQ